MSGCSRPSASGYSSAILGPAWLRVDLSRLCRFLESEAAALYAVVT